VRLRIPERGQLGWVAQCVDDLVESDDEVRLVMSVVEKLDVSGFYESIKAREGAAGRDATDPRLLVALWLYACIRGFGSARELARQCEESAPFRWLCGGVTVNHRMLSEFRVDHGEALDHLFTQVLGVPCFGITATVKATVTGNVWADSTGTGTGIEPAEMEGLFQRFHRVRSVARSYEGTGIGLALVKELTELHGGEVAATTAPCSTTQ